MIAIVTRWYMKNSGRTPIVSVRNVLRWMWVSSLNPLLISGSPTFCPRPAQVITRLFGPLDGTPNSGTPLVSTLQLAKFTAANMFYSRESEIIQFDDRHSYNPYPVFIDEYGIGVHLHLVDEAKLISSTTQQNSGKSLLEYFTSNFNRYLYYGETNELREDVPIINASLNLDPTSTMSCTGGVDDSIQYYQQNRNHPLSLEQAVSSGGRIYVGQSKSIYGTPSDNIKYIFNGAADNELDLSKARFVDGTTLVFIKSTDKAISIKAAYGIGDVDTFNIRNSSEDLYASLTLEFVGGRFYIVAASGQWETY